MFHANYADSISRFENSVTINDIFIAMKIPGRNHAESERQGQQTTCEAPYGDTNIHSVGLQNSKYKVE